MSNFADAYQKLRSLEGGYSNDPTDRGKETFRGITRRYFFNWPGWKIIDQLKLSPAFPNNLSANPELEKMVSEFYKEKFWDAIGLDAIQSQDLAEELFDTAVNMGVFEAMMIFQKAINLLNNNQKIFPDILTDGKPGKSTMGALAKVKDIPLLVRVMNIFQGARYIEICQKDPSQEKFFAGWIKNRTR